MNINILWGPALDLTSVDDGSRIQQQHLKFSLMEHFLISFAIIFSFESAIQPLSAVLQEFL